MQLNVSCIDLIKTALFPNHCFSYPNFHVFMLIFLVSFLCIVMEKSDDINLQIHIWLFQHYTCIDRVGVNKCKMNSVVFFFY